MTPAQKATRRRLLEALRHAERAVLAGPREPRMTQEQLRELQQLRAERDKARLALDAFNEALGLARERPNWAEAQTKGRVSGRVAADRFAAKVLPIIRQIQATGVTSPLILADALNARGIATARGGIWRAPTVRNLLARGVGR